MALLQLGGPFLIVGLLGLLLAAGAGYYVYTDASGRDANRTLWTAATVIGFLVGLLPGFVVLGAYLLVR